MNVDLTIFDDEIKSIMKNVPEFRGVFMRDKLPDKLKQGIYIINTERSFQSGKHWVSLIVYPFNCVLFIDSFGTSCHDAILQKMIATKKDVYWNDIKYQNFDNYSSYCGYFSMIASLLLINCENVEEIEYVFDNELELVSSFLNRMNHVKNEKPEIILI
jgi:hypothetical protein